MPKHENIVIQQTQKQQTNIGNSSTKKRSFSDKDNEEQVNAKKSRYETTQQKYKNMLEDERYCEMHNYVKKQKQIMMSLLENQKRENQLLLQRLANINTQLELIRSCNNAFNTPNINKK